MKPVIEGALPPAADPGGAMKPPGPLKIEIPGQGEGTREEQEKAKSQDYAFLQLREKVRAAVTDHVKSPSHQMKEALDKHKRKLDRSRKASLVELGVHTSGQPEPVEDGFEG